MRRTVRCGSLRASAGSSRFWKGGSSGTRSQGPARQRRQMADGEGEGNSGGGAEIVRPDALPESYWDATAKAPKYEDLGKDLTELTTLRTERATREAAIPKEGK